MLFLLCELPVANAARVAQLATAAVLLAAVSAVHTHTVLSRGLQGWKAFQPFKGGASFMILQAVGWTLLASVKLFGLCFVAGILSSSFNLCGITPTLGVLQLVAQCVLVASMSHFDASSPAAASIRCFVHTRKRSASDAASAARHWGSKGVPLPLVVSLVLAGGASAAWAIYTGGESAEWAGRGLLAMLFAMQAAGVHMMWTLTWCFAAACCYLMGAEAALPVMAVMGLTSISMPWYVGRAVFRQHNFPGRALVGLGAWLAEEVGVCPGYRIYDLHGNWAYISFLFFDTALHILPALLMLQDCAWTITSMSVVYSILWTTAWGVTMSLHHNVVDYEALLAGRLRYKSWGRRSLYEPRKVGEIYRFENPFIEDDGAFRTAMPGFLLIIILSHIAVAAVASVPGSGGVFFALGGGHFVSTRSLLLAMGACAAGGSMSGLVVASKVMAALVKTCKTK